MAHGTLDGLSKCKVDPCGVCGVKASSVLCVQCGKRINGRCARVKLVTHNVFKEFYMQIM